MGVLWGKIRELVVRYWPPNELVLLFGGSYVCTNFDENRSRNATARVLADRQIYTLTDANRFLANVNSRSRSLYVVVRPSVWQSSVVCNVRAPYLGDWNFRQCFYAIWYDGHPWSLYKNFTEIFQGNPSVGGVKHKRGSRIWRFWTYRTLYLRNGARQELSLY